MRGEGLKKRDGEAQRRRGDGEVRGGERPWGFSPKIVFKIVFCLHAGLGVLAKLQTIRNGRL